jgi:heme exporter protein D
MDHSAFVAAAYAISAITLLSICGWVWLDSRGRKQELKELEAAGIRRRSASGSSEAGA